MTDAIATRLAHAGSPAFREGVAPVSVPVVRTSTVRYESVSAYEDRHARRAAGEPLATYGRQGMDTHRALEEALVVLEGGHRAFLAPSGLSAITLTFLALLSPGDHALVTDSVYSPVRRVDQSLLSRLGIHLTYYSPSRDDPDRLVRPETRLIYAESPSSLLFEVLDLPAIARVARRHGIPVAVDNTWGAGYLYRPLALGADIAVQAATKYIAGHSDVMLGAVVVRGDTLARKLSGTVDALGLSVGADEASLALRGVRTLPVRLARHGESAREIAAWLASLEDVARVFCPALPDDPGHALWRRDFTGTNGLVSFEFANGGEGAARAFLDALRLFGIGASWGGFESLALMAAPARIAEHSHWQGHGPVVRLHVGLEDPKDLVQDLARAFAAARAAATVRAA